MTFDVDKLADPEGFANATVDRGLSGTKRPTLFAPSGFGAEGAGRPAAPCSERSSMLDALGGLALPRSHPRSALVVCSRPPARPTMHTYTAIIERCPDTRLYVGYVPGFPGAHSQGETLEELNANLREVIELLLEEGEPVLDGEFVGTQTVMVA